MEDHLIFLFRQAAAVLAVELPGIFVTDKGSYSESVELVSSDIDERDAAVVSVKSFRPSARAVRTFGVKIECEGPLIINGLALQNRLLGGVK